MTPKELHAARVRGVLDRLHGALRDRNTAAVVQALRELLTTDPAAAALLAVEAWRQGLAGPAATP